jgi:hypothetical protein
MNAEPIHNYSSLILECFKTDPELIEKWHIEAPASVENCAKRTTEDLKKANVSVYELIDTKNNTIGYFGKEILNNNEYLSGFFIKPEYRNKETIKEFWNCVNLIMDNNQFFCGIYKKNTKAYSFLMKNNGFPFEDGNFVFFMFTKGME